ncbi:MAG: DNA-3-methyladenine glycosylase 2 family protein [Clostridia bacterium]|nr:DNA-3-methyladenine glycosylase 2 family protein [Clostridia bacterium]
MKYKAFENKIEVYGLKDFELKDTLMCGQCFRFKENEDGSFWGVAFGKVITLIKTDDNLTLFTNEEDFQNIWRSYFDLDIDYTKIKEDLSKIHPTLAQAAKFAPGIRILRQEPFEALISFIISQNNNIKRISGIVERLCTLWGEEIAEGVFAFPTVDALSKLSAEDLAPIRAGFRARYIVDAVKKVKSGEVDLEKLNSLSFENAKAQLMKITGVGEKVAHCVLLYGLHRLEGFPMDVWMKRAMAVLFPDLSGEDFGEFAGIAQQYIFHYARLHPELFENG